MGNETTIQKEDVAIYVEPKKRMTLAVILMCAMIGPCMFGYGMATAMMSIGTELNGLALAAWLFTGSNIVQMVIQPLVPAISNKITLPRLVLIGMIVQVVPRSADTDVFLSRIDQCIYFFYQPCFIHINRRIKAFLKTFTSRIQIASHVRHLRP